MTRPLSLYTSECPLCFAATADPQPEVFEDVSNRDCLRCGPFTISDEATSYLAESVAPRPLDYRVSHVMRWRTRHKDIIVDTDFARRVEQRRYGRTPKEDSLHWILQWLNRGDEKVDELTIEGWCSVALRRSPRDVERVIQILERRGLIDIKPLDALISIRLTEAGVAVMERRSTRQRRNASRNERRRPPAFVGNKDQRCYASTLRINDVKCFGAQQVCDFRHVDGRVARWTFIIGENGVGKTTILQMIAALIPVVSGRHPRPRIADELLPIQQEFSRDSTRPAQAEMEWHGGDLDASLFDPMIFGVASSPDSLDTLSTHLIVAGEGTFMSWGREFTYATNYENLPQNVLIVGYGATRIAAETGLVGPKEAGPIDSLFDPHVPLRNSEEWLLSLDYSQRLRDERASSTASPFDRVKRALISILPGVTDITINAPDERRERPWVGFKTDYGIVGLEDLSLGYKSTIGWIVDLASRMFNQFPKAENPLSCPAVVLIDEIDLHLHPRWQREITACIEATFPAVQFIATTHSPLTIQGTVEANLMLLKRAGNSVCVANDVDEIQHWRIDQILTSELFNLDSTRTKEAQQLNAQRIAILSKPHLSDDDLRELEKLATKLPRDEIVQGSAEDRAKELLARLG